MFSCKYLFIRRVTILEIVLGHRESFNMDYKEVNNKLPNIPYVPELDASMSSSDYDIYTLKITAECLNSNKKFTSSTSVYLKFKIQQSQVKLSKLYT